MKLRNPELRSYIVIGLTLSWSLFALAALAETAGSAADPQTVDVRAANGSGSTAPSIRVGQCVLGADHRFVRFEDARNVSVVPLEHARLPDSGCPQLRDYSRAERVYGVARPEPVNCSNHNFLAIEVGTVCRTLVGGLFERIRNQHGELGWRDLGSRGLVWYDRTQNRLLSSDAKAFCQAQGFLLPSSAEFMVANNRGLQEVFPAFRDFNFVTSAPMTPPVIDPASQQVEIYVGQRGTTSLRPMSESRAHAVCVVRQ